MSNKQNWVRGSHLRQNPPTLEAPTRGNTTVRLVVPPKVLYLTGVAFTAFDASNLQPFVPPEHGPGGVLGRGDDTAGNSHRAQIPPFEFFEFFL